MLHVPYRGDAPAITDLLPGQVQVHVRPHHPVAGANKAGQLRALAVTTRNASRSCRIFRPWPTSCRLRGQRLGRAFVAPKDTPPEIIAKLNTEINAGLADDKIKRG